LKQRQIARLLVPIERLDILSALTNSVWQPLDLASPLMLYGRAGDAACSPRIVEVLRQEQLISRGPWTAAPLPQFGAHSHWDFWGLASGQPDAGIALAQARMFASRRLYTAALKLLFPVLREATSRDAREMFHRLQSDLAWREHLEIGHSSQFRTLASQSAQPLNSRWQTAIAAYGEGRPDRAAEALHGSDPQEYYARGWLRLEAGEVSAAHQEFRSLASEFPDHELTALAAHDPGELPTAP
jgi:hypothetical protein